MPTAEVQIQGESFTFWRKIPFGGSEMDLSFRAKAAQKENKRRSKEGTDVRR